MDNLFQKYRDFTKEYKDIIPEVEKIPILKQNSFQYVGGQIQDKNLYAVVNSAETMLKYDIDKDEVGFLGKFSGDDFKWSGGSIYKGVFYAFSRKNNSLLAFDIQKEIFSEIPCHFQYEGEHHYGGVCTKDGIIYQPPRNNNNILKWNIETKECEEIIINDGMNCRYCGSIIHPNGYIYFVPEKDFTVLKMNIKTEEIIPIGEVVQGYSFDLKIAPDGNIYGFRSSGNTNGILKIDTKNDAVSILHEDVPVGAYGTKVGINGKLYSLPGYTNDIWEFDPETQNIRVIYTMETEVSPHYAGGAVDINGDIYGLPVFAENIIALKFNSDAIIPTDIYNAFFCDFY